MIEKATGFRVCSVCYSTTENHIQNPNGVADFFDLKLIGRLTNPICKNCARKLANQILAEIELEKEEV